MKLFKTQKQQETYSEQPFEELTDEEMEEVNGGLNPQPLPPVFSQHPFSFNQSDEQGIIIVGGDIQ